jgi:hypothetical protein
MEQNLQSYYSSASLLTVRYDPYVSAGPNLASFTTQGAGNQQIGRTLTSGLRDVFKRMSESPDSFNPAMFLQVDFPLVLS